MNKWNLTKYLHFHSRKSTRPCYSSINVAKRGRANQTQYVNDIKSIKWIVEQKVERKAKYIIIIFPVSLAYIIISVSRYYYGVTFLFFGVFLACLGILLVL